MNPGTLQKPAPNDPHKPNGSVAAKETTMKRFLQSVFAIPRMSNETKSAASPKRPSTTPLLEVRSQVKAGEFVIKKATD
jgi:hypothetical protein